MQVFPTIVNFREKYVPRATQALLFILVVLIPFCIRYVFDSPIAYQTGAYSDFTSLSIYISDFVLLGLVSVFALFHMKQALPKIWLYPALAAIAWLFLEIFLQSQDLLSLQLYFSVRFAFLIIFAAVVSQISVSREKLAWLFSILGAIQGLLATIQFYTQKSIGLYYFGESHLSPDILGVAKIVAHGTKMIRGYGTFPHSNLLAGFLVTSTLFNLYLIAKSSQKSRDIWLYLLLAANIFGLFVSLSRGGIIALLIAILVIFVITLINKRGYVIKRIIAPLGLIMAASATILFPYLSTRATITDNATKERLFYTEIGERIIADHALTGVGPGTSVLHMKQYANQELQPWEIQPIHNYWLILWAEWGIGAILLIVLILMPVFLLFKQGITVWSAFLLAILCAFLALFLLDHYFYTIWPTQVLLWLILGLILEECFTWNNPEAIH